jgi:dTMP kinase
VSPTSPRPEVAALDLAPGRLDDTQGGPDHSPREVLRYPAFRRLWLVLGLSSLGDWLGLLAITTFAALLAGSAGDLTADGLADLDLGAASLAVSGVFVLRLAPALLLGPIAGVLADRLDRRLTMVVGDVVRGLLFLSIPLVGTLEWLYVATVLVEITALFWMPAKDAMIPNLVPRRRLEAANQLSVIATYGSAPLAALAFLLLVMLSNALDDVLGPFATAMASPVDLALYVNAATFLVSASVVARLPLPEAARGAAVRSAVTDPAGVPAARPSVWRQVVEGWAFIARTPVVRGLVGGMIGAFAAGGFVIGLGLVYVAGLGAGAPGYGVLFGAVFVGMALGVWQGPRTLRDVSRRRLFASSIAAAGVVLVVVGLSPNIVLSTMAVTVLGFFAGLAWVTGMTLLGAEVDDAVRGRTFAFVQTGVRVVLVAVMAAAPLLAAAVGERVVAVTDSLAWTFSGAGIVFVSAGLLAVVVGLVTFRQLDDRPGLSLRREVVHAIRRGTRDPIDPPRPYPGFFLVIEGGDGSGKSTTAAAVRDWLVDEPGHDVVLTREPGGTEVGAQVRRLVLDWDDAAQGPGPVPRAEALLFAADRAQHVTVVVEPALAAGAVVVSDRYVDSSVAYQGARGDLTAAEVARLSRWATNGLRPDLTVVLDVDPALARARMHGRDGAAGADRVESAGEEFHEHVRRTFLGLAAQDPRGYLVVDATRPPDEVVDQVVTRLRRVLPLSAAQRRAMAERLAAGERDRQAREAAAVAEAEQEDAQRARVREQLAAAAREAERLRAEQAAAEAELRRQRQAEAEAELRDSDTAVLPVLPADGARLDAGYDPGYEQGYDSGYDQGYDSGYRRRTAHDPLFAPPEPGYGLRSDAQENHDHGYDHDGQGYADPAYDPLTDPLPPEDVVDGDALPPTRPQRIELPDDSPTSTAGRPRRRAEPEA